MVKFRCIGSAPSALQVKAFGYWRGCKWVQWDRGDRGDTLVFRFFGCVRFFFKSPAHTLSALKGCPVTPVTPVTAARN